MSAIVVVAEKAFVFDGKLIEIGDKEIVVHAEYIGSALDIYARDLLRDIFAQHWQGQSVVIKALDGEPLRELGIVDFVSVLCSDFEIPKNLVKFVTHDDTTYSEYQKELRDLEIFWSAAKHTKLPDSIDKDAKFIGTSVGRYSPPRLRTIYLLAKHFPKDSFIICQSKPDFSDNTLRTVKHLYLQEIQWLESYSFAQDIVTKDKQRFIPWIDSYRNYHNIWAKYHVEVVCETHANSGYWFTEKTARCLFTAKPFVLLAGPNTLAKLRDMGFKTFGDSIDESYDKERSWPLRLDKIIGALKELQNNLNCNSIIEQMYVTAKHNQQHYIKHVQS